MKPITDAILWLFCCAILAIGHAITSMTDRLTKQPMPTETEDL